MAQQKLHEILGSQKQVFNQGEKVRSDLLNTFAKQRHLFSETLVKFTPNAENAPTVIESQSKLQSSVAEELRWVSETLAKVYDSEATIDEANTKARADVTLPDGTVLLVQVPATQLLQLDKRLSELLALLQMVPTLDPAKGFSPDANAGFGVFQARIVRKSRTKKEQVPLVLYPATDKHPAQTQLIQQDVVSGTIEEQEWSSMLTPAMKAKILERVEQLRTAVKQARARANDIKVEPVQIGRKLLDFVLAPLDAQ